MILITFDCAEAQNILTLNGYVPESELKVGDKVIGYDNGRMVVNTIEEKRLMMKEFYSQQNEGFVFYIINNRYKFFSGQSIYANGNVIHVSELKSGDEIYDDHHNKMTVAKITRKQKENKWLRFIISGNHSYFNDGILVHNASRFWVGGGGSPNWNKTSNTNWSATSGGSNNASVPTSADDVTFDGAGTNGNTASTVSAAITVLSLTFSSGYTNTVTINTTVALTIAGNFTDNSAHSWTVNGTGSMTISAASTITSNGKTFPGPVAFSGNNTKTLSGNWTITGTLTSSTNTTTVNKTTSEVLTCGGLTVTGGLAGTISITLTGGTWSGTNTNLISGTLLLAGNITISGGVQFSGNGATLKYSSGTITTTGSTLTDGNISGTVTFDTDGITWNNVTFNNVTTVGLSSLLTVSGTLTLFNNTIFTGSAGFTCGTLTTPTAPNGPLNIQLVHGVTYTITTAFTWISGRVGSTFTFVSDDPSIKAILTLNPGASCNVLAHFTRIDASAGRTIYTFNGTITSCININPYTDLKTISKTFVQ